MGGVGRCQAGKLQAKQAPLAEVKAKFTAHEGLGRLTDIVGTHWQKAIILSFLISMFSSLCVCACARTLSWFRGEGKLVPLLQEGHSYLAVALSSAELGWAQPKC